MRMTLSALVMALGIAVLSPPAIQAQDVCWTCQVQYYEGNDCYMDSCMGTWLDGFYTGCSQAGSCDDEYCNTSGDICAPHPAALDGRTLDAERLLTGNGAVSIRIAEGNVQWVSDCSGAVLKVAYAPGDAERIARATRSLSL